MFLLSSLGNLLDLAIRAHTREPNIRSLLTSSLLPVKDVYIVVRIYLRGSLFLTCAADLIAKDQHFCSKFDD